ncbi:hypothetical protein TNIN_163821 [Trichonephila inaurata madagascariensis]|uniref:Uncharacterized protein n=1 Tax=Trichonephila inaurata madagascariensis TaxID=2747483 RepID=A0A8X6XLN0_9ARAC|nr:hypothetical protein TNIN_163821 [Trichonephila inaurata madagascariensis]
MIVDELSIPQAQVFEIVTGALAMRKVRKGHSVPCSRVSCQAQCNNAVSSLLQPRLSPARLFSDTKNKIDA